MAFLTTNALCVPVMGAAVPRRSLIVARASTKSAEHQDPATMADGARLASGGRRRAMMLFGAATALTASTAISQSARAAGGLPGGWSDIRDVSEPRVQELGKWAIAEHNAQTGDKLQFVQVTSGKQQVVAGMNYILGIEAKGPSGDKYEASLFDPLPSNGGERRLNCFLPMVA